MASGDPVVVIGAGLAGLAAALHLQAAGTEVVLLEGSDAVGGRVRTDTVDGFRLDRGFQVHNTAYPAARRLLDHQALDLRDFVPGALVHVGDELYRVSDPRRRPQDALATLAAPIGSVKDKIAIAALAARVLATPPRRLLDRPERSTYAALRAAGISDTAMDRFFRPFLSGVFLEAELSTSSRFFELVLRCFAIGSSCLPATGIAAIPEQLAARLAPGTLRLEISARQVSGTTVHIHDAEPLEAAAVLVATDPATAHALLPELGPAPQMHGLVTDYHVCAVPPIGAAVLVLDGEGGPVANTVVLTNAVPGYSPDGRALVSTSLVGAAMNLPEPEVRRELGRLYGVPPGVFSPLARYLVPAGLPVTDPPAGRLRQPSRVRARVHVAGDHRASPSTQGALSSGVHAATAILADAADNRRAALRAR